MNDFRPRSASDRSVSEYNTEKLIVLPGFEVSQPRKKPVDDIFTWIQCFSRYTAAMAKEFPQCTTGFMSQLLTMVKAYSEAKHLTGMDVSLYHELCSSRTKQVGNPEEARPGQKRKHPAPVHVGPRVSWLYNDRECNLKNGSKNNGVHGQASPMRQRVATDYCTSSNLGAVLERGDSTVSL